MRVFTADSRKSLIQKPFRLAIPCGGSVSQRPLGIKTLDLTFEENDEFVDMVFDCIVRLKIQTQFAKALNSLGDILAANCSQLMLLTSNGFTKEISKILSSASFSDETGSVASRIISLLSQDFGCCCDLNPSLLIPLLQYGDEISIKKSIDFINRCKDVKIPNAVRERAYQILDNSTLLAVSAVSSEILKSATDDKILQLSFLSPRILITSTQVNPVICQSNALFERISGLLDDAPDVSLAALCNIMRWNPKMAKKIQYVNDKLNKLQSREIPICWFSSYLLSFCVRSPQNKKIKEHLNLWLQMESDPDIRIEIRKRLDAI